MHINKEEDAMKKTIFAILIAGVAILTGCSTNATATKQQPKTMATTTTASYEAVQTSTSVQPIVVENYEDEEAVIEPAAPTINVEWQTLTYQWEDKEGYKFEATIKVSPWINTENSDYLASAWNEVSKGETLPEATPKAWGLTKSGSWFYIPSISTGCQLIPVDEITDYYYCVGEVKIRNLTEGWDITSSKRSNRLYIGACQPETEKKGKASDYNMMSYTLSKVGNTVLPTWADVNPLYTSNEWSAPFVFVHFENKTPKMPEGENIAEIQNGYFCIDNYMSSVWKKDMHELSTVQLSIVE